MLVVLPEVLRWRSGDTRFCVTYWSHEWEEIEALRLEHASAELVVQCLCQWMGVRLGRITDPMSVRVLSEVSDIDVEVCND